jgi:hypothetical protein
VHADGKALLRRVQRFARAVAAGVADDHQPVAKAVDRVRNQHDVLVPRHELPFARGAANNDAPHAVFDLVIQQAIVGLQIELAVGQVGRLDGRDERRGLDVLALLVNPRGGRGREQGGDPHAWPAARAAAAADSTAAILDISAASSALLPPLAGCCC